MYRSEELTVVAFKLMSFGIIERHICESTKPCWCLFAIGTDLNHLCEVASVDKTTSPAMYVSDFLSWQLEQCTAGRKSKSKSITYS